MALTVLRYYRNKEYLINNSSFAASLRVVGGVMLLLVIGNLAQIAIWGGMFQLLGEYGNFNAAFYHSAVNFATLGYGDVVMSEKHKLLGPLESLNGILMIGVSHFSPDERPTKRHAPDAEGPGRAGRQLRKRWNPWAIGTFQPACFMLAAENPEFR
ncbi:ion channel [Thiolapillus sp.]|uniref:ion channel n=2 Tax=Thiolapillus sp. TaxID=2017437 RepID=UPI0025DC027D|nr:ion channel [Thiolapillus sp.]